MKMPHLLVFCIIASTLNQVICLAHYSLNSEHALQYVAKVMLISQHLRRSVQLAVCYSHM